MFESIRMRFGPRRLAFVFHYLRAMAGAKSIKEQLLPIIEKSFDNPWVASVELDIRFYPDKRNRLWRLFKSPPKNDTTGWDAPVTVTVFRKRRGKERPALCMSLYIRSGVLYIAQLQGMPGTDVPAELRPWPKLFIEACKKFACQAGLREVRVPKASTLYSCRVPYGSDQTEEAVSLIKRRMELLYDRNALQGGMVPEGDWFKWQNARGGNRYIQRTAPASHSHSTVVEKAIWGSRLSISQHATRVTASLGLIAATTAILFQVYANDPAPQRLVYFYLLPVVAIAILYTGRAAMLCAGVAILCADYFLENPAFSFYTTEWEDLIWFAVLAAFAIRTAESLLAPSGRDTSSSR